MKPKKITTIIFSLFLALSLSVVTGCKDGSENGGVMTQLTFGPISLQNKQTKQRIKI